MTHKPQSGDLFATRFDVAPSAVVGTATVARCEASRRLAFAQALDALPPLRSDPAPWSVAKGGASVNLGGDAAPKLRFEAREHGLRNAPLVSAAPTLYNLTVELVYALVEAERDAFMDETLGIACDTLAAIHDLADPEGARSLRRACGVNPEPRSPDEGGPLWGDPLQRSKKKEAPK